MSVFFGPEDYLLYLELLRERCLRYGVTIWAYCLMPNHVHLLAAPQTESALGRAVGECHRKYAVRIHRREGWTGHLWQQRFYSCPLDEAHLQAAVRYVLRNPVRAGLVGDAISWPWSSARAHLDLAEDPLIDPAPLSFRALDWTRILTTPDSAEDLLALRSATRSGSWGDPGTARADLIPDPAEKAPQVSAPGAPGR